MSKTKKKKKKSRIATPEEYAGAKAVLAEKA